jgi:hypothetical protein
MLMLVEEPMNQFCSSTGIYESGNGNLRDLAKIRCGYLVIHRCDFHRIIFTPFAADSASLLFV